MRFRSSLSILTQSPRMERVLAQASTVADSNGSVLLVGETGVGKELFADYLHRIGPRSERPIVKVSLSAMPHELLESELFGHERGSFTHALNEKKGLFELAHTGTLFLDDIDDVPLAIQTKLLRVLESREVLRVGGTATIPVDVRLISASKADLRELVKAGLFRPDLFYRINVIPLEIPPLRERPEDVALLFAHFLRRFAPERQIGVSEAALDALRRHDWPGNVRELRNIAQRLALFASDEITPDDLPAELQAGRPLDALVRACTRCMTEEAMPFQQVVACLEVHLLRDALDQSAGNQSQAARRLGLSLSTLRDKLHKHGLDDAAGRDASSMHP